jgi:hypothetical protein
MKTVFFRCKRCESTFTKTFKCNELKYSAECCIGDSVDWFKIRYGAEKDAVDCGISIIPPLHEYFEPAIEGENKIVHSKKQLESYAKEKGFIIASDNEIRQESAHQRSNQIKEENARLRHNVMEAVREIHYRNWAY